MCRGGISSFLVLVSCVPLSCFGGCSTGAVNQMKKRLSILSFLLVISGASIASVIADFAIAAGGIAGISAFVAVAGLAVGAPAVVPAAIAVGLAMELANYALYSKSGIQAAKAVPQFTMNPEERARYDAQQAAVDQGGGAPTTHQQGEIFAAPGLFVPGTPNAPYCITFPNDSVCQSAVIYGCPLGSVPVSGSVPNINIPGQCEATTTTAPYCTSGTVLDANGLCQAQQDVNAPNYVITATGTILPNPSNMPSFGVDWVDNSAPGTVDLTAPDGSTVKAGPPVAPLDNSVVEITVVGSATDSSTIGFQSRCYADGSCNESTVLPSAALNDAQGNPYTVPVVVTQPKTSSGANNGPPIVQASTTSTGVPLSADSTVAAGNGGSGATVGSVSTSAGVGTGTGTTTGSGSCTSGDCSTETTQVANKGILQKILDFFTGDSPASADPTARTGAEVGESLAVYGSALAGVKGWQLPAHTSECPSGTFTIPNSSHVFSFDGHCTFAAQNLPLLSSIFLVLWNLSAMMIILRL